MIRRVEVPKVIVLRDRHLIELLLKEQAAKGHSSCAKTLESVLTTFFARRKSTAA